MREIATPAESIEVAHLLDQIRSQDQRGQVGQLLCHPAIDMLYSIPRTQQSI